MTDTYHFDLGRLFSFTITIFSIGTIFIETVGARTAVDGAAVPTVKPRA